MKIVVVYAGQNSRLFCSIKNVTHKFGDYLWRHADLSML